MTTAQPQLRRVSVRASEGVPQAQRKKKSVLLSFAAPTLQAPSLSDLKEAFTHLDEENGGRGLVPVNKLLALIRSFGFNPSAADFKNATAGFEGKNVNDAEFVEILGRMSRDRLYTAEKREAFQLAWEFMDLRPGEAVKDVLAIGLTKKPAIPHDEGCASPQWNNNPGNVRPAVPVVHVDVLRQVLKEAMRAERLDNGKAETQAAAEAAVAKEAAALAEKGGEGAFAPLFAGGVSDPDGGQGGSALERGDAEDDGDAEKAIQCELDMLIATLKDCGDIDANGNIDYNTLQDSLFGMLGIPGYDAEEDKISTLDYAAYDQQDLEDILNNTSKLPTIIEPSEEYDDEEATSTTHSENPPRSRSGITSLRELMTVEEKKAKQLRVRLTRFMKVHDERRVREVDEQLRKHKGREEAMFRVLVAKYGPEPEPEHEFNELAEEPFHDL